jgi:hypothetical protein
MLVKISQKDSGLYSSDGSVPFFNKIGALRNHLNRASNFYNYNILNYEIVSFELLEYHAYSLSTEVELSSIRKQERVKSRVELSSRRQEEYALKTLKSILSEYPNLHEKIK